MVATFSPHRDAGGTIHFPSHSAMHVDPGSAIRQLRRSLSRSPSKSSSFFLSSRVHSPAKTTGYISSPLSPSRRSTQGNFVLLPTAAHQSPFAVPYPPSAKIVRPVMRRTRTSPISPMKRVLNVSTDQGNATPCQPVPSPAGEENLPSTPIFGLRGDSSSESTLFNHALACTEPTLAPKPSLPRVEKRRSENFGSFSTASPLKRSDGTMNLDQVSRGSPSAKRRSIQLTGHAEEFNVFDNDSSAEIADELMDTSAMGSDPQYAAPPQPFGPASAIPRRSSSLRRSTVQQRQNDRSIFSRSKASGEPTESPTSGTVAFARPRMPHDSNLHQPNRDSPFTSRKTPGGSLFSTNGNNATQGSHAAHPLSRTITQSSSSSSFADDSPTHEPARKNEHPQPMLNFSKSLPVGATRPALAQQLNREDSTSSTDSFATPENYKLAKPLPAAFMSTGLISKKSRNAEDPLGTIAFNKNMPDTPCKRPVNLFPMGSKAQPDQPLQMPRLVRQSCATPASPFNPPTTARPKPGPFARGMGLFEGIFNKPDLSRRASIASLDDDDHAWSQSPSAMRDSQVPSEFDFPPTPTKQAFFPSKTFPPVSSQIASFDRLGSAGANSSPLNDKFQRASPRTPQDHAYSLDPSGLPISGVNSQQSVKPDANAVNLPATPTGPRDSYQQPGKRQSLQLSGYHVPDVDASLTSRFEKVELIGTGEFSQVYRVSQSQDASFSSIFSYSSEPKSPKKLTEQVWAVKKSKQPYSGMKDRERRIREVDILKGLTYSDHIISFFDSWEDNGHLYIQTEFCEEGSLDVFLADVGLKARLDDFRIWKVLLELSLGLKHIHDSGLIHLDLKPANVLITFEGILKIADFGMATRWPAEKGIEGEGDREYIGPEILRGQFDKPADVFSLGLIIFETAGNVELPDNGVSWQKLRNGDLSDVPSLTWSLESSIARDATGNPILEEPSFEELCASDLDNEDFDNNYVHDGHKSIQHKAPQVSRSGELLEPPNFMVDAEDEQSLDRIVGWMISPEPSARPTADQILQTLGVQFAKNRRRAGATIFEGNWGPADEILVEDAEMIDV